VTSLSATRQKAPEGRHAYSNRPPMNSFKLQRRGTAGAVDSTLSHGLSMFVFKRWKCIDFIYALP
jgi:hypothetical protein